MPGQSNITLNSVVFSPGGSSNGVARWWNRTGGYGTSFRKLLQRFTSSAKSPVTKVEWDLEVPVVQTEDDACACAGTLLRTSTVKISVWLPSGSTHAERVDVCTSIQDLVTNAAFMASVIDLDPAYG